MNKAHMKIFAIAIFSVFILSKYIIDKQYECRKLRHQLYDRLLEDQKFRIRQCELTGNDVGCYEAIIKLFDKEDAVIKHKLKAQGCQSKYE